MSAAHDTGGRKLPGQLRRSAGRARRAIAGLVARQRDRRNRNLLVGVSEIPAHPPSKCVRRPGLWQGGTRGGGRRLPDQMAPSRP
jgi:hypothetical protein